MITTEITRYLIVSLVLIILLVWFVPTQSRYRRTMLVGLGLILPTIAILTDLPLGFVLLLSVCFSLGGIDILFRINTLSLLNYSLLSLILTIFFILLNTQVLASVFSNVSLIFVIFGVVKEVIYEKIFEN